MDSTADSQQGRLAALPSVDRLLRASPTQALIGDYGRMAVRDALREVLTDIRQRALDHGAPVADAPALLQRCRGLLEQRARPSLRPVFNLTGTVLHTNLGRAPLPDEARAALDTVASGACNLEYDLDAGARGERDQHVEHLLCAQSGAEAAMVVNNNAAAVLLMLNTLAAKKEVIVSRGELIEIGGSFRMPELMAGAGCTLREVGTTNRTHLDDYAQAIGPRTRLLMKVHTSNFVIRGFTSAVEEQALAELARARGIPFAVDLGSGTLVDLAQWGLPRVPTPAEMLARGVDLVSFSGDKLLGGPQAGILTGSKTLIRKLKRNPLLRALRIDKLRLAALEAVLKLYPDPQRLAQRLPTLRLLTRPQADIERMALDVLPAVQKVLGGVAVVSVRASMSQIGSGSLPMDLIPSACVAIVPTRMRKGTELQRISSAFRRLPIPVIGHIEDGALCFDLRCLEDAEPFVQQLPLLAL